MDGIPSDEAVNVVRADPARRGLLYAGTERGVHVSFDDGEHWQSLRANLPVTSVRDIEVHGDDVVIATHGRGFWILDDVSPLRQAKDVPAGAPSWLFRPSVARRVRADVWEGTPFPKDEPAALPSCGPQPDELALPRGDAAEPRHRHRRRGCRADAGRPRRRGES